LEHAWKLTVAQLINKSSIYEIVSVVTKACVLHFHQLQLDKMDAQHQLEQRETTAKQYTVLF
jgi:hypothetical protein